VVFRGGFFFFFFHDIILQLCVIMQPSGFSLFDPNDLLDDLLWYDENPETDWSYETGVRWQELNRERVSLKRTLEDVDACYVLSLGVAVSCELALVEQRMVQLQRVKRQRFLQPNCPKFVLETFEDQFCVVSIYRTLFFF